MKKNEIKDAIKKVLPDGWRIRGLWMRRKHLTLGCPVSDRFGAAKNTEEFLKKVSKIEKACGITHLGGGMMLGSDTYDIDFYWE